MFYLNTIEQLFLFVEQLDQLEVCLPYSSFLAGISKQAVFQNLRWNSNKTSLYIMPFMRIVSTINLFKEFDWSEAGDHALLQFQVKEPSNQTNFQICFALRIIDVYTEKQYNGNHTFYCSSQVSTQTQYSSNCLRYNVNLGIATQHDIVQNLIENVF